MALDSDNFDHESRGKTDDPPRRDMAQTTITRRGLLRLGVLAGIAYLSPFGPPAENQNLPPQSHHQKPTTIHPALTEAKSIATSIGINIINAPENILDTIVPNQTSPYPLTNTSHLLENTSRYQNLGVAHTPASLQEYKYNILDAMRQTDIVCLEWESPKIPLDKQYFRQLHCLAEGNGKVAKWIDHHSDDGIVLYQQIAESISKTLSTFNILFHRELHTSRTSRAWWQKTGLSFLIGTLRPVPRSSILTMALAPKAYNPIDFSYISDARTVQMLALIQQTAREHPDKRLLSITGDWHAHGIDFYLKHPKWFAFKKSLYKRLYGLAFPME